MDLENLSTNWKKLQKRLSDTNEIQRCSVQSRPKKQFRGDKPLELSSRPKKRKLSSSHHSMGNYVSSFYQGSSTAEEPSSKGGDTPSLAVRKSTEDRNVKAPAKEPKLGKYVALDCEMVGTTSITPFSVQAHRQSGEDGALEYSILARATLVNYNLEVVYDAYVLPPEGVKITNYRTEHSGITSHHLDPRNLTTQPKSLAVVQKEVSSLISNRILIGHALVNDLAVLGLNHPLRDIRDTSRYEKFRKTRTLPGRQGRAGKGRTPALRFLARDILGWDIQNDVNIGHDSAEDARAAMALFVKEKHGFEEEVVRRFGKSSSKLAPPTGRSDLAVAHNGNEFEEFQSDDEIIKEDSDVESGDSEDNTNNTSLNGRTKTKRKKKKKKSKTRRHG